MRRKGTLAVICIIFALILSYIVCKPVLDERVIKKTVKNSFGEKLVFELADLQMKYEDFMMTDFYRIYMFSCEKQMEFYSVEKYDDGKLLEQGWIKTRREDWEQIRHFSDDILSIICYEALLTKDDNYFLCYDLNNDKYAVSNEEAITMLMKDYYLAVYSPKNNICMFVFDT